MNVIRRWLQHPHARLTALVGLVLLMPLCLRAALGWSDVFGYLSDMAIGSLLIVLLHQRPWWLALPVLLVWSLLTLAAAELVSAVGRLPNITDLHYLVDPQFLENSTGGGFAQPWLAAALLIGLTVWLITQWAAPSALSPRWSGKAWAAPVLLLVTHWGTAPACLRCRPMASVQSAASAFGCQCW